MSAPIIDDLLELMPHTVSAQPTAQQWRGPRSLTGTAKNYRARVIGQQRLVRTSTGEEKVSTVRATLAYASDVTIWHQFTLPAGFAPTSPQALSVDHFSDENGYHHTVVQF